MMKSFAAIIERDLESGMYVGVVPHLIGAHTYAATIDELQIRLAEVITLCLEEMEPEEIASLPVFTGITQIEVPV